MSDPYDLQRFVDAQDSDDTYARAVAELHEGEKTSHWMWFVFPQLHGLGRSTMAQRYAVSSLDEAGAYLDHPVLGPRLIKCAGVLSSTEGGSATQIFGIVDAQKLHSSMTLFHRARPHEVVFARVLDRYFGGEADPATDDLLRTSGPTNSA